MNTRKTKSNASWNSLTPEARDQIETWLFDDHLSYTDAFQKAKTELAFTGSLSSLKRFGLKLAQDRVIRQFADSLKQARQIENVTATEDQLRNAGMKVMAQAFLNQAIQFPENVRQWGWLAKLLIQNHENQIRERTAAEHQKLRRQSLELSRERFHFDAVEQSLTALPELKALERARQSPQRSKFHQAATILTVRRRVFGERLPDRYPTTNDPAEQAAIEAESNRLIEKIEKARVEEAQQAAEHLKCA